METRSMKRRIGPLPGGDRRGTPGAGAGCLSMRTVSGEELNRRAPTGSSENATADNDRLTDRTTPTEPYSPSTISYTPSTPSSPLSNSNLPTPTLDVAREANAFLPTSTKAGKPRVRMKWSKEVNLFIMRTYYYITKLETDLTTYRKQLHELFSQNYPKINVTEQRIADQRRAIVKNNLLKQETLNIIKEEIKLQLETENENQIHINSSVSTNDAIQCSSTQLKPNTEHTSPSNTFTYNTQSLCTLSNNTQTSHMSTQTEFATIMIDNDIDTVVDHNLGTNTKIDELCDKFRTALTQYSGMDPLVRPQIPKLRYSSHLFQLVNMFNRVILFQFISDDIKLTDLHTIVYCVALVISEELNYKVTEYIRSTRSKDCNKPPWQIRLEKDIEKLRADCGRLTQYINNNRSRKIIKHVKAIFETRNTHTKHENNNTKPEEFLDTLKQKLALKVHRLKRYKKAQQRKNDNIMFSTNEKTFYRNLHQLKIDTDTINKPNMPTQTQLETFWSDIWEQQVHHNDKADWIMEEENKWNAIKEMEFTEITETDINNITARLHNWKSPGIDKIHNFWYKKLSSLHKIMAKNFTDIIIGKQKIPDFIATGITYMLPKSQISPQPSQYRPITCLPTIYKILTSAITTKINKHVEQHNIIAEEQKGCRRGHMGCKEQLIIDSTIHKHATSKNKNLHCTYIDYKKAFDSIPHSWLIKILQIYKINPKIINFLRDIMSRWKTTLYLTANPTNITSREIAIRKGIYQGDSLSPLWFCLALNPLSHLLRGCRAGYCLKSDIQDTIVSHLIYMDDIKLYGKTEREMQKLIDTTAQFSKDINMEFGLDKCRTLHIKRGRIRPGNYAVNDTDIITAMEPTELYKYLGYKQLKGLDHTEIKNTLTIEFKKRINALCKTQLTGKHLIKSLNTYAIPILTYSFGIIKWTKTDIEQIERTIRTTLTKHNNLHPKSAIERLTIKREYGGRGLIDLNHLCQKQVRNLKAFFHLKSQTSEIHKAIVQNDLNYTPLNLHEDISSQNTQTNDPQIQKLDSWKRKVLHGRHPHDLEQPHINSAASNKWLKIGNLFPETEGFIIAIQDQIVNTKNYRKFIIKDPSISNDKCRKCHLQPETIQHITGACTTLTQTDYTHRHNQVVNIIHQKLALKHKLIQNTNTPYYKYKPQTVLENDTHKLYFDRAILTDRTIHYNRPDITLQDKSNKITYLIDIAVPNTHNLQKTISEKINKYTELKDEVARIWNQNKVYIIPIVLSTTGVIPNHLLHGLKLLQLNETLYIALQKAAILNTCRIVRKFLQIDEHEIPHNI
ncbi:unnamed protein product [Euphydryas editha]|uniref:Reverse transcriptase domain-containing protein n=1 Tax=Euphydryas editha TaxID=104508 RepID=A0AAU9V970_EUPED|nr:unnamed protein product [Euphydryas editha]